LYVFHAYSDFSSSDQILGSCKAKPRLIAGVVLVRGHCLRCFDDCSRPRSRGSFLGSVFYKLN
jgi:hypothetical protein